MNRLYSFMHIVFFLILLLFLWNANQLSSHPFVIQPTFQFTQSVKEDPLYKEIIKRSAIENEEPQNAYIDRVWKKTPGRNGIKINIEKSYEKMKKDGAFHDSLLIYEQIPPSIQLKDLPASPIFRGHPEKNMVALLINVSWGEEYIPSLLSTLKEQDVKATFFIEGKWAKEQAKYVQMIEEQGHLIGNHAYNHPDMAKLSKEEVIEQIDQTNQILKAIIEKTPKYFAPPSGSFNKQVVTEAHHLHMETILWTVDTIDWKNPTVSVMQQRVLSKIHPGAMILMHPTKVIDEGLSSLIEQIKEKGYRIGTVEQLLSSER